MKTTNSSNQQVHTAVQQYIQYTMVCSHVASNSVLSAVRHEGEELHGETYGRRNRRRKSMRRLKCECLGLAANGQLPSWVHTGLTASTVKEIRCQT